MRNLFLKFIFIFILFFTTKATSQILLNNDSCFKIYLDREDLINDSPSDYNKTSFIIVNNTEKNYIINTHGFMGSSFVFENGKKLSSYIPKPSGYSADWDEKECSKNILVIPKNKQIKAILYLDIVRAYYSLDDGKNYEIDFETEHTKQSPYYYGCTKYVDSLVNKGYKIYEGTLKGKIKLVPKK